MAKSAPISLDINQAEDSLKIYTPEEIKWHIERGHSDLVNYAKALRVRAKQGRHMQSTFEKEVADKNHWVFINGRWIKQYPQWGTPPSLLSVIKDKKYAEMKQKLVTAEEEKQRLLDNNKSDDTTEPARPITPDYGHPKYAPTPDADVTAGSTD